MERLFNYATLVQYLPLTTRQLNYLVKNELIPHYKLPSGEILFRASDIEAWLKFYKLPREKKRLSYIFHKLRQWLNRCKRK